MTKDHNQPGQKVSIRVSQAPEPITPIRGTSYTGGIPRPSTPESSVASKPDWDTWRHIPDAELSDVVALSLDIEPSSLNSEPPEFVRRLKIATANLGKPGGLKAVGMSAAGHMYPAHVHVSLADFAAWAIRKEVFDLPDEFPRPEKSPEKSEGLATIGKWPWGNHETQLLRKLAAAADRFWTLYDATDASTAPTNKQVIDWLKQEGVPARTAEIMATILRADGLRTGPRK